MTISDRVVYPPAKVGDVRGCLELIELLPRVKYKLFAKYKCTCGAISKHMVSQVNIRPPSYCKACARKKRKQIRISW